MKEQKIYSPKDFLKDRRPEEFSDSVEIEQGLLERPVLEYYLATLSQKSLELNFETFVKQLCQKIVCPNLLEQTGPVAGGDGKTDTQTFPVSEQIQVLWFEGYNDSSHEERWAFAVSTQKTWKAKCRKDVEKIVGTKRGYTRAFCVTNQAIKSDQRSKLEDELTGVFDIQVTIFDLSWILDQIYNHKLESIAIETLNIPVSYSRETQVGENDYSKALELERLTKIIDNEVDPQNITFAQVDYFLEVAKLTKELEKPVMETQGLFERTIRVSKKFGTHQQILDAHYEYAWGAHFWLEDFGLFEENLVKVYECLLETTSTNKWEKLLNLLTVHRSYVKTSGTSASIDIDDIFSSTVSKLQEIAADETRPSNSLNAEISLCLLEFAEFQNIKGIDSVFRQIHAICEKGKNLVGFPFEKIYKILDELDDLFFENEAYEELSDFVNELSIQRIGETKTASISLKRGIKRFQSNKPYQAIKLIGKSLGGLYKDETLDDFIYATAALSFVYEMVGLKWASRASALYSSSLITDKFWKKDEISTKTVRSYWRLARAELNLGRLIHSLKWYELVCRTSAALEEPFINEEDIQQYEATIGHLICNTDFEYLKEFEYLPDFLDSLGLHFAYGILLFVLGHEEKFASELEVELNEEQYEFMLQVRDCEFILGDAAYKPMKTKRIQLNSNLLGCKVSVEAPNRTPFIELSEAIVSTLESFFATAIIDSVGTLTPRLNIVLNGDDDDDNLVVHEFSDGSSGLEVEVVCSNFDITVFNKERHKELHDWFATFIIETLCRICISKDMETLVERYLKEDDVLTRSVSFSVCFNSVYNILGESAHNDLLSLTNGVVGTRYQQTRDKSWDSDLPAKEIASANSPKGLNFGDSSDFPDRENIRHEQVFVSELIKPYLWDKAFWQGVLYITPRDVTSEKGTPPLIALLFENPEFGEKVFHGLREELGNEDKQDKLRISIVKGISKENPTHYRVVIGEDFNVGGAYKQLNMVSRIHEMTPATLENLARFEASLNQSKEYFLSFGALKDNRPVFPRNFEEIAIKKTEIRIIDAWTVGENDFERVAIRQNDDPVIPDGVDNAPINSVL
ncbi:hypothetical protein [Vibrio atlanticus]|uniref:hypothetical protein n=1 Tax=Vibrio atlanticus TaxID=693153 RepID=UPI003D0E0021